MNIAVIGAGIVGLATARAAAMAGHQVTVFERSSRALGASVRNFGMFWPLGQSGSNFQLALRSAGAWKQIASETGLWLQQHGALLPAYEVSEQELMQEFIETKSRQDGYQLQWLSAAEALALSPMLQAMGLRGALHSQTEMLLNPREAIPQVQSWLASKYQVNFRFSTAVVSVAGHHLVTASHATHHFDHVFVCNGVDFEWLFPEQHRASGIQICKLQMMRTAPVKQHLGLPVVGPLSLAFYDAFATCKSWQPLRQQMEAKYPAYFQRGIHVMAAQHQDGSITIGDSHQYAQELDPFDEVLIRKLILDYLGGLLQIPDMRIAETWQGVYAKIPGKSALVSSVNPTTTIVNALGGSGMTLSFALAEDVVADTLA
jgi:D-hydroxyproline dehydrogenase subunit beta